MKIKELIEELKQYKNQDLKVIITFGDEDEDKISSSEFELLNKDEEYEYMEIFVPENTQI